MIAVSVEASERRRTGHGVGLSLDPKEKAALAFLRSLARVLPGRALSTTEAGCNLIVRVFVFTVLSPSSR